MEVKRDTIHIRNTRRKREKEIYSLGEGDVAGLRGVCLLHGDLKGK